MSYEFPQDPELKSKIETAGCFKLGHTELTTGHHTDGYITAEGFLNNTRLLYETATAIGEMFEDDKYDFMVGPLSLGFMVASYTALSRNKPCSPIFLPKTTRGTYVPLNGTFHKDFIVPDKGRVLIIEDCIGTGSTIENVIIFLRSRGLTVVALGAIFLDTQRFKNNLGVTVKALMANPFQRYDQKDCLSCAKGEDILFKNIKE